MARQLLEMRQNSSNNSALQKSFQKLKSAHTPSSTSVFFRKSKYLCFQSMCMNLDQSWFRTGPASHPKGKVAKKTHLISGTALRSSWLPQFQKTDPKTPKVRRQNEVWSSWKKTVKTGNWLISLLREVQVNQEQLQIAENRNALTHGTVLTSRLQEEKWAGSREREERLHRRSKWRDIRTSAARAKNTRQSRLNQTLVSEKKLDSCCIEKAN